MIRISSKREGFRRCGVAHPAVATDYADDVFTDEQMEILQNDPMLIVEILGENGKVQLSVKDTVTALKAAQTLEEFEKLLVGEIREGVLKAAASLRKKLDPPA